MKYLGFAVALSIFLAIAASAQTAKAVKSIDARYSDITEKAQLCEADEDHGRYGDLVMNTLTINSRSHEWRAVGIYGQTFKFFYRGGDTETRMYPDQLLLVKVEKKVSNRNYYEEYLYGDTGELIFYFSKQDEDGSKEIEVYFSGKRAVRVTDGYKSRDRLTKADIFSTKQRIAAAEKIKKVFINSVNL